MNADQRNILVYALALLIFIFWRVGTQFDYGGSLLIWQMPNNAVDSIVQPEAVNGLRLRMGFVGIVCGLIMPFVLAAAAFYVAKSDRK